jgi:hypothetical protein
MAQAVTIRFQYTEAEYVAAVREYFDPFRTKLSGVIGALILSLGIFMGYVSDDSFVPWMLSFFGVVALAVFYRSYYVAPRHWYKAVSGRGEYTLQYSDAGIVFHSKDMDSTLQWSLYRAVRETDRFYFLVYGKHMFSVIPKRAFTSAEQEEAFRALLRRHLAPQLEPSLIEGGESERAGEYVPQSPEPPDWR